jgi:hypothetical protein
LTLTFRDEFPTARFPEVDKEISDIHAAYLQHPAMKPEPPDLDAITVEEVEAVIEKVEVTSGPSSAFETAYPPATARGDGHADASDVPVNGVPATPDEQIKPEISSALMQEALEARAAREAIREKLTGEIRNLERKEIELVNKIAHAKMSVNSARQPILMKRNLLSAGALVLGIWLGYGIGTLIARRFNLPEATWLLLGLVTGGGILALVMRTAQMYQHAAEANKEPSKIPYLAHLADCYTKQVFKVSPDEELSEEQKRTLGRRLEKWKQERQGGVEQDEAHAQQRLGFTMLYIVAAMVVMSCIYAYGVVPPQRIFESATVFGFPAALLVMIVYWLAPVSLRLPELGEHQEEHSKIAQEIQLARHDLEQKTSELSEAEQKISAIEAERREIELKKLESSGKILADQKAFEIRITETQLQRDEESRKQQLAAAREAAQTTFKAALAEWEKTGQQLLKILRDKTNEWEKERGFSRQERINIIRQLKIAKNKKLTLDIFSGLSIIVLTYFASITVNEIIGGSYIYPGGSTGLRVAPMPWAMWIFVIFMIEKLVIVPNMAKLSILKHKEHVLNHGFEYNSRFKGYRYSIATNEENRIPRKSHWFWISVGIAALLIEFACNAIYLYSYGDSDGVLAYVIALLPMAAFVGLIFPLAETQEATERLGDALLTPERPSQIGLAPAPVGGAKALSAKSKQAHDSWEALGYKDPDAR